MFVLVVVQPLCCYLNPPVRVPRYVLCEDSWRYTRVMLQADMSMFDPPYKTQDPQFQDLYKCISTVYFILFVSLILLRPSYFLVGNSGTCIIITYGTCAIVVVKRYGVDNILI